MADYVYSIENDFPGGLFTSAISERASALCASLIPGRTLEGLSSDGTNATFTFDAPLSGPEQLILDGGTTNPSGGIIAASTQYFDVLDGVTLVLDNDVLQVDNDGFATKVLTLQLKDGTQTPIDGTGQDPVDLDPEGLAPLTDDGNFDNTTGQFTITIGPEDRRGIVRFTIKSGSLPQRHISVEFS